MHDISLMLVKNLHNNIVRYAGQGFLELYRNSMLQKFLNEKQDKTASIIGSMSKVVKLELHVLLLQYMYT